LKIWGMDIGIQEWTRPLEDDDAAPCGESRGGQSSRAHTRR